MIHCTFIDFHFILFIVRCRFEDPCLPYTENDDNYCELLIIFKKRNKNFSWKI